MEFDDIVIINVEKEIVFIHQDKYYDILLAGSFASMHEQRSFGF